MTESMAERYQYILRKLNEKGFVKVQDLSKELRASGVTIRKDIKALEVRNLLIKTHGGATSINPFINIPRPIEDKVKLNVDKKQKIAKAAVSLLEQNDTIIIASGTTVIEFARNISPQSILTVLSATIDVSEILSNYARVEVIQLGGIMRKSSNSVIGSFAEKMLTEFSCNKLFIGVDGIDLANGITTTSTMEASLNNMMIQAAKKVIVLTDSSKLGRRGFGRISGLEKVDIIITDKLIEDRFKRGLEDYGIKVIIV